MLSVVEGFENYGSANSATMQTELRAKWLAPDVDNDWATLIDGPTFGKALQWSATELYPAIDFVIPPTLTIVMGFAYKHGGSGTGTLVHFTSGSATQTSLYLNWNGLLEAYRGTITSLALATEPLRVGTWNYIDVKVVLHDSTGSIQVRLNGQDIINETNIDTKYSSGTFKYGSVSIEAFERGAWDDIYIYDDTGGTPSLQGSRAVENLSPTSDDTSQWTPSIGSDHYALVNDTTINDTTYVSHSTINEVDDWGYSNITEIDGGILGLAQWTRATTNDGGIRTVNSLCESNSTEDLDSVAHSEGFETLYRIIDEDPDTSTAWTVSGVNAATFGVEVGD